MLWAVQQPFRKPLLAGKVTKAARRSKPSFYAVSTEDRTINPEPTALHGQADGREDDRASGEPSFR